MLVTESQKEIDCAVHLGARLYLHRGNTSSKKPGSQLSQKRNFAIFYSTPLHFCGCFVFVWFFFLVWVLCFLCVCFFLVSVTRIHRIDCRTHGWVFCVSNHNADSSPQTIPEVNPMLPGATCNAVSTETIF